MTDTIKILDCTLRDGGYYNQWDFPFDLVKAYLHACADARIDVVEIGFRYPTRDKFLGAYAYSLDDFLSSLELPAGIEFAVMCDGKDLNTHPGGAVAAIDEHFSDAADSPISIVRLAIHSSQATTQEAAIRRLHEKGYKTTLNLMQVATLSDAEVTAIATEVEQWPLDVLYVADSFGSMTPETVQHLVSTVKAATSKPIGIHTHNNTGRAVDNTLAAMESGCTWLDGTVTGMGRGAGNAPTEYLLLELARRGYARTGDVRSFLRLALEKFTPLQKEYGWGSGILYYLSAVYGIHPSYVQEMLDNDRYSPDQLLSVLDTLRQGPGARYSSDELRRAAEGDSIVDYAGSWVADTWADGRDVLLIAPGQSVNDHLHALELFIKRAKPLTLCLNVNEALSPDLVDAYVMCHPDRLRVDLRFAVAADKPIIAPRLAVESALAESAEGLNEAAVLDYGVKTEPGRFSIAETQCVLPRLTTAPYALAAAAAAKPRRLFLAGFDGFAQDDRRGTDTNHALHQLLASRPNMAVIAITPTRYPIQQGSVYAPL